MSKAETRDFRISNNMIYHLVFSQAGTIGKAIAELIMNSQDARSPDFKLVIDDKGFKAVDKGRGFQSRKEIEDWFEELGFEHSSDLHQESDRFSRFGLGRSQILAFSRARWITHSFVMDVDIKERGMGYDLLENQPHVEGCIVEGEWYEPLSFSDLKAVQQELENLVAYVPMEVSVNGTVITKKNSKWDYETDKVYIRRRETGELHVYNQGVFVRSYPHSEYGSGIVVSKVPLTLTIARNEVLHSICPVWKEVRAFLKKEAGERSRAKARLTDSDRQLLLNQWIDGDIGYSEIENLALIEDCTGRKWRISKLLTGAVTVYTSGPKLAADRLQQSKVAFVMSPTMIEAFGAESPEVMIKKIEWLVTHDHTRTYTLHRTIDYIPIDQLLESNNNDHLILKDDELTKTERVALTSLSQGLRLLQNAVYSATSSSGNRKYRALYIGKSDNSHAWTDGFTFVALNRDLVRKHIRDGLRGFTYLANIIIHELVHEKNTACSHEHGAEFFQTFHDVLCGQYTDSYGTAIRMMMSDFLKRAQKEGLKLSRNEVRDADREVSIEREVNDSTQFADEIKGAVA